MHKFLQAWRGWGEARLRPYLSSDDSPPQPEKQAQVPVLGTTWALWGLTPPSPSPVRWDACLRPYSVGIQTQSPASRHFNRERD